MEAEHASVLTSPHLWVNIALLIFIVVAGPKLWKALASTFDQRSLRIKNSLDEAQKLRDEAQSLLNEYQRRQKEAAKEAEGIIIAAKELAEHHTQEAMAALEASMARREKLALEKIAQAEAQALADVRSAAAEAAIAAASQIMSRTVTGNKG